MSVLASAIFYCLYLPEESELSGWNLFAFVLVYYCIINVVASIVTAFVVYCMTTGNSVTQLFRKFGLGNAQNVVAFLVTCLATALIFVIGINNILRSGVEAAGFSQSLVSWLVIWAFINVTLRLVAISISKIMQTRVLLFAILLLIFAGLFIASLLTLMQPVSG